MHIIHVHVYGMEIYMYLLNIPAPMYIVHVHTLSVKNVRDGGLFETDEDDGREEGAVS